MDKRASGKLCKCTLCRKFPKRKDVPKLPKQVIYCVVCGGEVKGRNALGSCSIKCSLEYRYISYIRDWKLGLIDGGISKNKEALSGYIRRYLFHKYDHKCCLCGWGILNVYTNRIPLQVDHIDGNHLNNLEENLRLVCPNCHSLTSTYGGANLGKGRKMRYKSNRNKGESNGP